MFTEETITLLAALYAELKDYEARRDKAARLLADDDSEYRQKILSAWDYDIDVKRKQIEQEEQKAGA